LEALIVRAGSEDYRSGGELAPVGERDDVEVALSSQADDLAWRVEVGTEAHGLYCGTRDQVLAGYAVWEADVVLDA
jgi:hypothetical protein